MVKKKNQNLHQLSSTGRRYFSKFKAKVPGYPYCWETAWNQPFSDHQQGLIYVVELGLRLVIKIACHSLFFLLQHQPKLFHNLLTEIAAVSGTQTKIWCQLQNIIKHHNLWLKEVLTFLKITLLINFSDSCTYMICMEAKWILLLE